MQVKIGKYILTDAHEVIECEDLLEWGKWMGKKGIRIVAKTNIGQTRVSTVFLGLDQNFAPETGGPPLIFETMIFDCPDEEGFCNRYHTWEDAVEGHNQTEARLWREENDE